MKTYCIWSYSQDDKWIDIDISCNTLEPLMKVAIGMKKAEYKLHLVELGDDYYKAIRIPKEKHGTRKYFKR